MGFFSKVARHADLVGRMARTLDVDMTEPALEAKVGDDSLRDIVFNCMTCQEAGECRDWLNDNADGATSAPVYCRNKAILQRLIEA